MGSSASSLRLACTAVALVLVGPVVLGGCGLVLDFDPAPRGASPIDPPLRDAGRERDARVMDAPRGDTGGRADVGPADPPEGGVVDADVVDAGDGAEDAGVDSGPPFVCASADGLGACSGIGCEGDDCGAVEGDRCRVGVCFCGGDEACRIDRHQVCGTDPAGARCECETDWADCIAGEPGCETNVMADAASCGGCGVACESGEACVFGVCRACSSDDECGDADGLACTTPRCAATGECRERIETGACLIDDVCFAAGDHNPDDACTVCDPIVEPRDWSIAAGAPCDDGDACTTNDRCSSSGACAVTELRVCAPLNMCHRADCDPAAGCTDELLPGFCFIGSACVPAGTAVAPSESCVVCDPNVDPFGWTSRSAGEMCDDGVACTESRCGAGSVCRVTASTGCPGPGGVCLSPGSVDPVDQCSVCTVAGARNDWMLRPVGTACTPESATSCLYGGACSPLGVCEAIQCLGADGTGRGLVCESGMCRCIAGRRDCDERADTGCECLGSSCTTCAPATGGSGP